MHETTASSRALYLHRTRAVRTVDPENGYKEEPSVTPTHPRFRSSPLSLPHTPRVYALYKPAVFLQEGGGIWGEYAGGGESRPPGDVRGQGHPRAPTDLRRGRTGRCGAWRTILLFVVFDECNARDWTVAWQRHNLRRQVCIRSVRLTAGGARPPYTHSPQVFFFLVSVRGVNAGRGGRVYDSVKR